MDRPGALRHDARACRMPSACLRLGLQLGRHVEGLVDASSALRSWRPRSKRAAGRPAGARLRRRGAARRARGRLAARPGGRPPHLRRRAGRRVRRVRRRGGGLLWRAADLHRRSRVQGGARAARGLLPGEGTLGERHERWEASTRVPTDRIERTVAAVIEEARLWTRRRYELPDGEGVGPETAWRARLASASISASSTAGSRSTSTCRCRPSSCSGARSHETYRGHHAARCSKDHELVRGRGHLEETLVLVPTPQSLVAEGIARPGARLSTCGGRPGRRGRARRRRELVRRSPRREAYSTTGVRLHLFGRRTAPGQSVLGSSG